MKKIIAVLMSAAILVSFAGCSLNELGLYNTLKGISNLEKYDFKGELTVDIKDLSFEMLEGGNVEDEAVVSPIDGLVESVAGKFLYEGFIDNKEQKIKFKLSKKNEDDSVDVLLDVFAQGKFLYIEKECYDSINELIGMAVVMVEETQPLPQKTISGTVYYEIDLTELFELLMDSLGEEIYYRIPAPLYDEEMSAAEWDGYLDGYDAGIVDFMDDSSDNETNYAAEYADNDAYKASYDGGYAEGKLIAAEAFADFNLYKDSFIEKANAAYLIKLFNTIAYKLSDSIIENLFDDFELGLVKKEGGNKYTVHIGLEDIFEQATNIATYIEENSDKAPDVMTAFLESLVGEEKLFISMFSDMLMPDYSEIDDEINEDFSEDFSEDYMDGYDAGSVEGFEAGFEDGSNGEEMSNDYVPLDDSDYEQGYYTGYTESYSYGYEFGSDGGGLEEEPDLTQILEMFEGGYDYLLEKTGRDSYLQSDSFAIKTTGAAEEFGLTLDIAINNVMTINEANKGNIGLVTAQVNSKGSGTTIRINIDDDNATGCGVYYSTFSDLRNAVKIEGVKQTDGSYLATLPAFQPGSILYFKVYTTDLAGNIVMEAKTQQFNVAAEGAKTGEQFPIAVFVLALGCTALCVLLKKKLTVKN